MAENPNSKPKTGKHPGGRPPKYTNPEELQKKIDEYFISGRNMKTVIFKSKDGPVEMKVPMPTISGLVLFCGFSDRGAFYDYESKPEFSHTIKRARSRIAQDYEEDLKNGLGVGAIFALKNLGWQDKTEIESKSEVKTVNEIIVKYENMSNEQLTDAIMERINGHKAKLN